MNWVGGSRNRFMMRNDMKKQREFFEKKKIQRKMKTLGIATSPEGASSGSMDLVNLFIVNQIAIKKENKDQTNITHITDERGAKTMRVRTLELPMSPCSPSKLCLVESQPLYSVQAARKRKHCIPDGFKHCIPDGFKGRQLSPVLESNMSDTSGLDYQHQSQDTLSPFSSALSLVSSSGPGLSSLQQRAQIQPHCSPLPWDNRTLDEAQFRPFSQPGGRECASWARGFNASQYQLSTCSVPRGLFGTEPALPGSRDHVLNSMEFSIKPVEGRHHAVDFSLRDQTIDSSFNQSDSEERHEEALWDISNEKYGSEAVHFKKGKPKIYLKEGVPTTSFREVNESQRRGPELIQLVLDPVVVVLLNAVNHRPVILREDIMSVQTVMRRRMAASITRVAPRSHTKIGPRVNGHPSSTRHRGAPLRDCQSAQLQKTVTARLRLWMISMSRRILFMNHKVLMVTKTRRQQSENKKHKHRKRGRKLSPMSPQNVQHRTFPLSVVLEQSVKRTSSWSMNQ
uniref:Uncharacterized protein n=1 Tax=Esox lucius TaxID=8010 RepID=A0AAY5LB15_ESOLU